jgi:hypothetical protein
MIFHLLQTSASEVRIRLVGTSPQWTEEPKDSYLLYIFSGYFALQKQILSQMLLNEQ